MKRFTYTARKSNGEVVSGEVEAQDAGSAAKLVRGKNLIVINIKPKTASVLGLFDSVGKKVKTTEIANFTRQFATMVNAGLPITESLSILRLQSQDNLEPIIAKILADVESGESLSTAFSKYSKVFSSTYVALIRAGETGGVLDKILSRIADDLEKTEEFKGKLQGALIYPAIVIVGMIVVASIMMIFVIPKLLSLYTEFGATLPLPTQILIDISGFFVRFWPLFLVLIVAGFFGFSSYSRTVAGRRKIDELLFKIPIFGPLQQKVMLTELARTLGLMIGAGVPIIEGMEVTAASMGNVVVRDALLDASDQVEKGFPIAFSFAKHPEAFPYIFSQMMAVGEESGKIDEVLTKLAQVFETESDQRIKTLTVAMEPFIMLVLGLGVGFLVVAVILPIYNLTNQF